MSRRVAEGPQGALDQGEGAHSEEALNAERRRLPMVKVEKSYVFEGPGGQAALLDLFEDRAQLSVCHFMFDPSWDEGCSSCSTGPGRDVAWPTRAPSRARHITGLTSRARHWKGSSVTRRARAGRSRAAHRTEETATTTSTSRWTAQSMLSRPHRARPKRRTGRSRRGARRRPRGGAGLLGLKE